MKIEVFDITDHASYECSACSVIGEDLVQVGNDASSGIHTAWICQDCLDKAKALFEADPVNQPVRDFSWALEQMLAGKKVTWSKGHGYLQIRKVAGLEAIFCYADEYPGVDTVWVAYKSALEATDWEVCNLEQS